MTKLDYVKDQLADAYFGLAHCRDTFRSTAKTLRNIALELDRLADKAEIINLAIDHARDSKPDLLGGEKVTQSPKPPVMPPQTPAVDPIAAIKAMVSR